MVAAISSCSVTQNRCAISPANAGGSVLQESCSAGTAGPQRSHHDWQIPQSNQALARSRNLVTPAACGACRAHIRDALRARPARERRVRGRGSTRGSGVGPTRRPGWRLCLRAGMRQPSSTVAACGCDSRDRKTARNTSTCAVRIAPRPLLDWVEQDSPIGHAHASRHSLKKTDLNPEEDASKTSIRRRRKTKKMHVQTG